jgi:holo-[acyl-carrier protein] synthase
MTDYEEVGFWRRHEISISTLTKNTVHHDATIRHLAGRYASTSINVKRLLLTVLSRWAAKEAIMKASPRPVSFHQILITAGVDNKPYGVILDTAVERKYTSVEISTGITGRHLQFSGGELSRHRLDLPPPVDMDGQIVQLSISHDGDYATAVALCPVEDRSHKPSAQDIFDDLISPVINREGSGRSALHGR